MNLLPLTSQLGGSIYLEIQTNDDCLAKLSATATIDIFELRHLFRSFEHPARHPSTFIMEEGTKSKKTVFVGNISDDTDETALYESFSTFGDILEVQLPPPATQYNLNQSGTAAKHRGFAFVTFSSAGDAQDAIDNMDMNELKGRVLKVNVARPMKAALNPQGNRAIWESEEWLKEHVKPLAQSGGVQGRHAQSNEPQETGENKSDNEEDAMEE